MKKKKEQKEVQFNPADYDYMKDMPIFGWIYEFKRRSPEYLARYEVYKKDGPYYEAFPSEDEDVLHNDDYGPFDPNKKWTPDMYIEPMRSLSAVEPIKTINLKWANKIETKNANTEKEEDFVTKEIREHGKAKKQYHRKTDKITLSCIIDCEKEGLTAHPFLTFYQQLGKENIVMTLIDISASMSVDKILEMIRPQLVAWRKTLNLPGAKRRGPKIPHGQLKNKLIGKAPIWKSYLIVYDLKKQGATFSDICNKLIDYDIFYQDENNVKRHYKEANKLINGGYKKYY